LLKHLKNIWVNLLRLPKSLIGWMFANKTEGKSPIFFVLFEITQATQLWVSQEIYSNFTVD